MEWNVQVFSGMQFLITILQKIFHLRTFLNIHLLASICFFFKAVHFISLYNRKPFLKYYPRDR